LNTSWCRSCKCSCFSLCDTKLHKKSLTSATTSDAEEVGEFPPPLVDCHKEL
jgi:hypothetical protein